MAGRFSDKAANVLGGPVRAGGIELLQVNLGYLCNMSCMHCHVEGGSARSESMSPDDAACVLAAIRDDRIRSLDITGGAPELNPSFRDMVIEARAMGKRVIVRTNLTILFEGGMEDLAEFYAAQGVELVASLPCYTRQTVDRVRGL
ncbi:hypothetical protein LCGC14_1371750, partial [marine sediment metagenome]